MTSKSILTAVTLAFVVFVSAEQNQQQQFHANNQAPPEMAAANPKLALPLLGSLPIPNVASEIKAPVPAAVGNVLQPTAPKLPGNLGINGNKWGSSLLAPLEGYLGGLIGTIPLPRGRIGLQQPQQRQRQQQNVAQNGLEK